MSLRKMKIRILGAGFYGCHLAVVLHKAGHEVVVFESATDIFTGASGSIPARIHLGFHYPRSLETRRSCQKHVPEFMQIYGEFTNAVDKNVYAIAADSSLVDFQQYARSMRTDNLTCISIPPKSLGLQNVEGALLTDERHIVTDDVKKFFKNYLETFGLILYSQVTSIIDSPAYDLTIDATFCANNRASVDRYEPCVVGLLKGPTDIAVTIMDGPFGSVYPWNEGKGLCSMSSAKWTPLSRTCGTWQEAKNVLNTVTSEYKMQCVANMVTDMATYYPAIETSYEIAGIKESIRAMPKSGAATRLVSVVKVGAKAVSIRAGKIDAVIEAERQINKIIEGLA